MAAVVEHGNHNPWFLTLVRGACAGMNRIRVGVLKYDQNWCRNITRHRYSDISIRKVVSPYRVMQKIGRWLSCRTDYFVNTHIPPVFPPVDLLHVWRTTCYGRLPWVVSTSTGLPFGWAKEHYPRGLALLASAPCKRIVVNSKYAYSRQERKLVDLAPEFASNIRDKIEILHTPQDLIVERWCDKPFDRDLVDVTLVGHLFFQKGGHHLLNVAEKLGRRGAPIRINVVSELRDGAFGCVSDEIRARALQQLTESRHVRWFKRLPNQEVLQLFAASHIGVLLSNAEAYGYSVLEAQACGCAMITTDMCALPELNDDSTGWILAVAGEDYDCRSTKGQAEFGEAVESQLSTILAGILDSREKIQCKGEAAITRIRTKHSPEEHAQRLRAIYFDAVKR